MNTNDFGTVAYCEIGLSRSKVWRTIAELYSGVHVITLLSRTGS